jgi:hypothetical protein
MMATVINRYNPSFSVFPIQNNRTGWKPVYLPVVLVVPARRDSVGDDIPNSDVSDVKFFIENAPGRAKVSGLKYQGIYVPVLERFVVNMSFENMQQYRVQLSGQIFYDKDTGEEKDYASARDGDSLYLTLENGSAADKITYYKDADYYDLSPISIATIDLKPYGIYNFVWQASYNQRILTPDNELFCIGESIKLTRISIPTNHPGDVHKGMVENTPNVYFDGQSLDKDGTVAFYRPFADVLQDIFDEQTFIRGINWITAIPAQYIPYLGYLVGWDPPYFGSINDDVRLSFIRNAKKLQKLKGSKRAISELFEIFGFTIDIVNLWYRSDGKAFIGPYDPINAGFANDYVTLENVCTTEPMLADNSGSGFGNVTIPLLYRPNDNFTIEAWLVSNGQTRTDLNAVVDKSVSDPASLDQETCNSTADGMLISDAFDGVNMSTVVGHAKILVDIRTGTGTIEYKTGSATLSKESVKYDSDTNILNIIYDGYLDLSNNRIFIFAIYNRNKITPSPTLTNLRSNRFDIRVLLYKDGEQPSSDLYDFLLDFLFKIKAFHSLLRKIIFTVSMGDVYNVTNFCVGGLNKQAIGLDAGELQVPPAIKPSDPTCVPDQTERGFKEDDINLRQAVMSGLEEEHSTWKSLDGTHHVPADLVPIINSLSRLPIPQPESSPCEFTQYGQDRVLKDPDVDRDHNLDTRQKLCSLEANTKDYCYKGRVRDGLDIQSTVLLNEYLRCSPCTLMSGYGIYWSKAISDALDRWKDKGNIRKSWSDTGFVRRAAWNDPLHYTNRSAINPEDSSDAFLAVRKPPLGITKDNLFFPGHRFIQMYGLLDNFAHPVYGFRPWDDLLNLPCPEDVPVQNGQGVPIPDLHPHITVDTNGDEWLVFDNVQLVYYGNGLPPDVSNLGDHSAGSDSGITDDEVTHAIYTSVQPLTGSEGAFMESDTLTSTSEGFICTTDPIFNSANRHCECASDESAAAKDYVDGYPSIRGRFNFDSTLGYVGDDAARIEWAEILGMADGSDYPSNLLFKVGSGIRSTKSEYAPYRLDCGCLKYACETDETAGQESANACNLQYYYAQNGDLDFDCDKIDIFRTMILPETVSACSFRLNGEISNLFMVDDKKITYDSSTGLPIGSFVMKDEYGSIQTASFVTSGDTLDITWISFEPRVWGQPQEGYKDGLKVFRKGIITTQRQILKTTNGQIYVTNEWQHQTIGYMQVNITCGNKQPLDPFLFHTECAITDSVEFEILCGPRWSDPSTPHDYCSWPDLSMDTSGNVFIGPITGDTQFFWINTWGNEEGAEITGCLN